LWPVTCDFPGELDARGQSGNRDLA